MMARRPEPVQEAPAAEPPPIDGPHLWARVRLAREGAAVERCHAFPHLMRYSVGHHTLDTVSLLVLCWQAEHDGALPSSQLLVAAVAHDFPEKITGDAPRPIKTLLSGVYDMVDRRATLFLLGQTLVLNAEERAYLDAADRFELWLWALEEVRRGNSAFLDWTAGPGSAAAGGQGVPAVFTTLAAAVMADMRPLTWQQLQIIGGLA